MNGSAREMLFTWLCTATYEGGSRRAQGRTHRDGAVSSRREVLGSKPGKAGREFPFDPDRKRMSTVIEMNSSTYVLAKGAPESVLAVCTHTARTGERSPSTRR